MARSTLMVSPDGMRARVDGEEVILLSVGWRDTVAPIGGGPVARLGDPNIEFVLGDKDWRVSTVARVVPWED